MLYCLAKQEVRTICYTSNIQIKVNKYLVFFSYHLSVRMKKSLIRISVLDVKELICLKMKKFRDFLVKLFSHFI